MAETAVKNAIANLFFVSPLLYQLNEPVVVFGAFGTFTKNVNPVSVSIS